MDLPLRRASFATRRVAGRHDAGLPTRTPCFVQASCGSTRISLLRRSATPTAPKPNNISAQLEGSGTAEREPNKPSCSPLSPAVKYTLFASPPLPPLPFISDHKPSIAIGLPSSPSNLPAKL